MTLVPSLLQAIIRLEGEAVVMHVGDRPYVVTATGQIDLATRTLTFESVSGIVNQLLPAESQRALDDLGGVQYELPALREFPGEHFTIVAARGGDDVWAEIRRRREVRDEPARPALDRGAAPEPTRIDRSVQPADFGKDLPPSFLPPLSQPVGVAAGEASASRAVPFAPPPSKDLPVPGPIWPSPTPARTSGEYPLYAKSSEHGSPSVSTATVAGLSPESPTPPAISERSPMTSQGETRPVAAVPAIEPTSGPSRSDVEAPARAAPPNAPAFTRASTTADTSSPAAEQPFSRVEQLLRLTAERGASQLYLTSGSRPSVRIDGELHALDNVAALESEEVESLLLTLMPAPSPDAPRSGASREWIFTLPAAGRVRCLTFRDHRGPGCVFRLMPGDVATAGQLGLSREIQALAFESAGLVIVAGPHASGKRTLMSALIDLINRSRHDHIISIETESHAVHGPLGSLVSQREVRGGPGATLAAVRDALRENPDVLAIEDLSTAPLVRAALEAAASGQLVIGGFPARDSAGVIDGIIELYPPEDRRQALIALAQNLRGIVSQVLLRRRGGGRVAARELLLNTPVVAGLIVEGQISHVRLAIEAGRSAGMASLNDALMEYVKSGVVDVQEAYRRAADRAGFRALMKRRGIDTSAIDQPV